MPKNNATTVDVSLYISCNSTPILWSWMIQLGDNRKTSVTSFLSHAAETVLRLQELGIVVDPDGFDVDSDLFADPNQDNRLRSIKQTYQFTVLPGFYPLLHERLFHTDKTDRGKALAPLVEAYLVGFWGRSIGRTAPKKPNNPSSDYNELADKTQHEPAQSNDAGLDATGQNSNQDKPADTAEKKNQLEQRNESTGLDADKTQAQTMLSGDADSGSNLDDFTGR